MSFSRIGEAGRPWQRVLHARTRLTFACAGTVLATILAAPVIAAAITPISQGYSTTDKLAPGSIVSLEDNSADHIKGTSTNNVNGILGVVINSDSSLLSLTNSKEGQVQVATSGVVQVLVSDINGPIAQGDQVTASPIKGVGMKATSNVKVVGIAQEGLTKKNSSTESYKDKEGQTKTVQVGQIPVVINVSFFFKQPEKTLIPSAMQNVANAFAGKKVDTLPIMVSLGIFLVTIIVVVSIIYSMIRSSIISVGRNPMSQAAIYRDLVQMSALVLGVIVVAVVSIYLTLTRL